MAESPHRGAQAPQSLPPPETELEAVPTTAEDIASAGRSCMAILLLIAVILVLLCIWIVGRSTGFIS